MSELRIDHSRADMERRMKLLEMAGGDLRRAVDLETWVISGFPPWFNRATGPGAFGHGVQMQQDQRKA